VLSVAKQILGRASRLKIWGSAVDRTFPLQQWSQHRVAHHDHLTPAVIDLHQTDAASLDMLVTDLRRLDAKRGVHRHTGEAERAAYLDFVIKAGTEQFRLERDLKSGVIPVAPARGVHG
jgi:hypothetical protein